MVGTVGFLLVSGITKVNKTNLPYQGRFFCAAGRGLSLVPIEAL